MAYQKLSPRNAAFRRMARKMVAKTKFGSPYTELMLQELVREISKDGNGRSAELWAMIGDLRAAGVLLAHMAKQAKAYEADLDDLPTTAELRDNPGYYALQFLEGASLH